VYTVQLFMGSIAYRDKRKLWCLCAFFVRHFS
jgi:hypothetical protein